jgi:hypothetical protein
MLTRKWSVFVLSFLLLAQVFGGFYIQFHGVMAASQGSGDASVRLITLPEAIDEAAQWMETNGGTIDDDRKAFTLQKAGKTVPLDYLTSVEDRRFWCKK